MCPQDEMVHGTMVHGTMVHGTMVHGTVPFAAACHPKEDHTELTTFDTMVSAS